MMRLNWYRSWPSSSDWAANNLDNRPHIIDHLPRIVMSGADYKTVPEHRSLGTPNGWPTDIPGFCLLEWDLALDPVGRNLFAALALTEPSEVLIAPYRFHDMWSSFKGNDGEGPSPSSRPVRYTDAVTDSFGFGCIYFPLKVLNEYLALGLDTFTDYSFGKWYHGKYGPARLTWEVHPQHLHEYGDAQHGR